MGLVWCKAVKVSHPTWVRGLKRLWCKQHGTTTLSHPTWVRGLKPEDVVEMHVRYQVAPHVGAWIETATTKYLNLWSMSHPTWVRGLKQR